MRILDRMLKRFGYTKDSRLADIMSSGRMFNSEYGAPVPDNYAAYLKAYAKEVWVYACIYRIATTIAGLPWKLYRKTVVDDKIKKDYVYNPAIYALFERPNDNDENSTWYGLIEWTLANLELVGNAYWLLDKLYGGADKRLVGAIHVLLASRMRVIPGEDRYVTGYVYTNNNGTKTVFTDDEITHFKYMAADNYYYGTGGLSPCVYAVDTIKEAQKTNLNIFQNGAMVDAMLTTDGSIDDAKVKRLRAQFKERYVGSEKAHGIMIADGGLKYQKLTENMKDLEFINGIKLSREEVCAAFAVPPLLVGILDQASYSNYAEATRIFYLHCIIPKLRRIEQVITTIVKRFDKSLYFEFDLANVDALKDDEAKKLDIITKYWNMGVPFNTLVDAYGLPVGHIEGGDIGYLPFSVQPVGTEQANNNAGARQGGEKPEDEGNDQEDDKSVKDAKQGGAGLGKNVNWQVRKSHLWKLFDRTVRKLENKYLEIINIHFGMLRARTISNLENGGKELKKISTSDVLFNRDDEIKNWMLHSKRYHKIVAKENGQRELNNLGLNNISFDIYNPRIVKLLDKYGLKVAESVIGTLHDRLKDNLQEGITNGESIPDLAKRVKETFAGYEDKTASQATTIARTETISVSNQAALEAYKQSGLRLGKGWLGELDDRIRESHAIATKTYDEGNPIPMDEPFELGGGAAMYPGGSGVAEEDINCRCSIFAVPLGSED